MSNELPFNDNNTPHCVTGMVSKIRAVYGAFTKENDGRIVGEKMYVSPPRKDGKYPVTHHFAISGRRINKLYTEEQLNFYIRHLNKKISE